MFLLDTNIISEARKGNRANPGVIAFRAQILNEEDFLPVQVIGELRYGVEVLKHRGDLLQAAVVEEWLEVILVEYAKRILPFNAEAALIWGQLMSPHGHNPVDKQMAAIALLYDLTLVTRNVDDFAGTGVRLLNPWSEPENPSDAAPPEA